MDNKLKLEFSNYDVTYGTSSLSYGKFFYGSNHTPEKFLDCIRYYADYFENPDHQNIYNFCIDFTDHFHSMGFPFPSFKSLNFSDLFNALLPISPRVKTIYIKVEGCNGEYLIQYAQTRENEFPNLIILVSSKFNQETNTTVYQTKGSAPQQQKRIFFSDISSLAYNDLVAHHPDTFIVNIPQLLNTHPLHDIGKFPPNFEFIVYYGSAPHLRFVQLSHFYGGSQDDPNFPLLNVEGIETSQNKNSLNNLEGDMKTEEQTTLSSENDHQKNRNQRFSFIYSFE